MVSGVDMTEAPNAGNRAETGPAAAGIAPTWGAMHSHL